MAISMLDNISYKGKKSDNVRSEFSTISEMVAYSENYLPDIYETFCLEDGNKYVFKRSNEADPTLGKWRLASSGSYELPTASSSTKGGVKIGAGLTMTGEVLSADEEPISEETDNILERKDDGLYVPETDLSNYVEKETGKGLSTNDLTDELKAQYDAAEENVQSDWSEIDNTSDAFILNKPTKLSDFANDSGFITKLVEDLENYYTKTQSYTKTEVNALVNAINQFNVIKVTELPTTDIDTHAIYFLSKTGTTGDVFDEYMYIDEEWELIGTTQIDLSEYAKKAELSQVETLPAATSDNEGRIYQYTGTTNVNYTNGYFYKCVNNSGVYSWSAINVQTGGGSTIQLDTLPTASATELGKIYQFIGTSTENYLNGSFYKCVTDGTDYSWVNVDTFPSWRGTSEELEEVLEDLPVNTRIEVTDDYDDDGYTKEEIDEMFDVCVTNPDGLTNDANSAFSTVDANNGKTVYYRCNANTPDVGFWWNIETTVSKINDAMFIHQKAMQLGGTEIYVRHSSDEGSTWTDWVKIAMMNQVVENVYRAQGQNHSFYCNMYNSYMVSVKRAISTSDLPVTYMAYISFNGEDAGEKWFEQIIFNDNTITVTKGDNGALSISSNIGIIVNIIKVG